MSLVSIVIPVYFNAASLPILMDRLKALKNANSEDAFEFIFVDDGSEDNSYATLCELAKLDQDIRIVKMARNFGTYLAITAGLQYARGDCAACLAADLQDPPETLTPMLADWKAGYKAVMAVRKDRHGDPWLTRSLANIFNYLYKKFVFDGFSPQGIGFFLIDRQIINLILASEEKNANLVGLILWSGFRYSSVIYDRPERIHGKSKWTFPKKVKYFIDSFIAFSYLPVRLATLFGLLFAILGGLYALNVIAGKLLNQTPVEGWSALMVTLLLLSGIQLMILGIIGEYLWRNFDAARKRPLYVVESFYSPGSVQSDLESHGSSKQ